MEKHMYSRVKRKAKAVKTYYLNQFVSFMKRTGEKIHGRLEAIADVVEPTSWLKVNGQRYETSDLKETYIFYEGNKPRVNVMN